MKLLPRKRVRWLSMLLGVGASILMVTAFAQQSDGSQPSQSASPQLTLTGQASAEIAQDTVKITLAAEFDNASQASVARTLGKTLDSVMKQAKDQTVVKARSGSYRVWPTNDKNGKISGWHGRGEIYLESTDFAAASDLAAELADRMSIANLNFFVSAQARAKHEEALLAKAAQAFRDRAQAATEAFGFGSFTFRDLDLTGGAVPYQPVARMMSMAADKTAVPLEGGTETVTVSVRGTVFLNSPKK